MSLCNHSVGERCGKQGVKCGKNRVFFAIFGDIIETESCRPAGAAGGEN